MLQRPSKMEAWVDVRMGCGEGTGEGLGIGTGVGMGVGNDKVGRGVGNGVGCEGGQDMGQSNDREASQPHFRGRLSAHAVRMGRDEAVLSPRRRGTRRSASTSGSFHRKNQMKK